MEIMNLTIMFYGSKISLCLLMGHVFYFIFSKALIYWRDRMMANRYYQQVEGDRKISSDNI